jgi:hypothetical protein
MDMGGLDDKLNDDRNMGLASCLKKNRNGAEYGDREMDKSIG